MNRENQREFRLFTQQFKCSYFPERSACTENFILEEPISPEQFDQLLEKGFRRFGNLFFRYVCRCDLCKSIRIPLTDFQLSRSQKRVISKNKNTRYQFNPVNENEKYFLLYKKHHTRRLSMNSVDYNDFSFIFYNSQLNTFISEFYSGQNLLGAGVLDAGEESLSSVYFVFDPDFDFLSPGIYSILREIEFARNLGKKYYYLGYSANSRKHSDYKRDFKPYHYLDSKTGKWQNYCENGGSFSEEIPSG